MTLLVAIWHYFDLSHQFPKQMGFLKMVPTMQRNKRGGQELRQEAE